jgi:hypothetical protein
MKIYVIDDKQLTLRDLTLDELDRANALLSKLNASGNEITGQFTNEELKELLSVILEPVTPGAVVDFGKTKESISVQVIGDFFLTRIQSKLSTQKSFVNLMKKAKPS